MFKRTIKTVKRNFLTSLEHFCIDISDVLTRLGNWSKRKRWEIEDD
jgi:hypothetical protein